jgi:hypothetical protein
MATDLSATHPPPSERSRVGTVVSGPPDRLKVMIELDVKHRVTARQRQAALEWFEKWRE